MSNNAVNDKKMSSNEEENEDEDEDGDVEDEEDEGKKSRKSSESNDSKFSPAVLGLLRVGDNFPKKEKKEPVLLNRRGMVS